MTSPHSSCSYQDLQHLINNYEPRNIKTIDSSDEHGIAMKAINNIGEESMLKCPYCQYQTQWKHNLKTHIRRHTGEKPYNCSFCNKPFACKTGLNMHIKIHTREKMFKCELCDYSATQASSLRCHIFKHHEHFQNNIPGDQVDFS